MKNKLQQHYGNRDRCFAEQYLPIHLPLEVQGTHMFNSPSLFLHRERRQEVQGTNGLPPHLMSPWAPRAAADLNILAVKFINNSSSMIHRFKQPGVEFPFTSVRYCDYELKQFARMAAESNGFVFSFFCVIASTAARHSPKDQTERTTSLVCYWGAAMTLPPENKDIEDAIKPQLACHRNPPLNSAAIVADMPPPPIALPFDRGGETGASSGELPLATPPPNTAAALPGRHGEGGRFQA
nr:beta-D-glucosyl crocetin beta-1,6-glucosyltransferase-like [Ipomoea batatas]